MSSPLNLTSPGNIQSSQYKVLDGRNVNSIFQNSQFSPYPNGVGNDGIPTSIKTASDIYSEDTSDISLTSIIKWSENYDALRLTAADFAYLKNIGVYPNNRLVIARRFPSAVGNDLTSLKGVRPMAKLITWVGDGEDFISVDYGENWEDAEASFIEVLNDIGSDMVSSEDNRGGMSKLGNIMGAGALGVPLPGYMEGLQYEVAKKLGLTELGVGNSPLGNPNIIRQAQRRSTLKKDQPGSGLMAKFNIKMVVEYEQKYIDGLDPSLVYLDIIQNALTFGTSDSVFQFNSAFAEGSNDFIKNLISGDAKSIGIALWDFVENFMKAIKNVGKKIIEDIKARSNEYDSSLRGALGTIISSTVGHVVSKYKVRLLGIVNALTGTPSAPWHVTIGNPKKPTFCSGDMITESVTVTLGKNLSFNDLPSYIKFELILKNARALGAQEIFNRFNTGKGRSYARNVKSFPERPNSELEKDPRNNNSTTSTSPTPSPFVPTPLPSTQESFLGPQVLSGGNLNEVVIKEKRITDRYFAKESVDDPLWVNKIIPPDNVPQPSIEVVKSNIADEISSSSENGYQYTIEKRGEESRAVVYDGSDVSIFNGLWGNDTEENLLNGAKDIISDNNNWNIV